MRVRHGQRRCAALQQSMMAMRCGAMCTPPRQRSTESLTNTAAWAMIASDSSTLPGAHAAGRAGSFQDPSGQCARSWSEVGADFQTTSAARSQASTTHALSSVFLSLLLLAHRLLLLLTGHGRALAVVRMLLGTVSSPEPLSAVPPGSRPSVVAHLHRPETAHSRVRPCPVIAPLLSYRRSSGRSSEGAADNSAESSVRLFARRGDMEERILIDPRAARMRLLRPLHLSRLR